MKLNTALLPLGLFVSNTLAVGVTITMAGGKTKDLDIGTTGECIDLFQGTHHARLNGGPEGTHCTFWLDSGCSGDPVGTISTTEPESDMAKSANGARCN